MITSRGCPKRCTFCAHGAVAYRSYRARSPENVLDEIELIARQGYTVVGISDDNFTADIPRARKILQGIIDRNIRLTIVVQGRVDAADYDLYCLMRKAGVKGITFGLESGNQEVLDFYRKDTTVSMNERAVRLADKAGLYTGGIFIFGAPMETERHFRNTYEFAASLPLDITTFWILDYTYGSALWEQAYRENKIAAKECNVPAGIERGTSMYPSKFIEAYAQKCFFRYYRRPAYWIRQMVKLIRVRDRYFLAIVAAGTGWMVRRKVEIWLERLKSVAPQRFTAALQPEGGSASCQDISVHGVSAKQ
jgi:anaerobic magnesium-protoporphyrin IX monomethyl ester cyclase